LNLTLLFIWFDIKHFLFFVWIYSEYFSLQLLKSFLIFNLVMNRYLLCINWDFYQSSLIICSQANTHFVRLLRITTMAFRRLNFWMPDYLLGGLLNYLGSIIEMVFGSNGFLVYNSYHIFTNFVLFENFNEILHRNFHVLKRTSKLPFLRWIKCLDNFSRKIMIWW